MNLTIREHKILSKIYQLRCMSYTGILKYIFGDSTNGYCRKLIQKLVSGGYLIQKGTNKQNFYYFITNKGISYLNRNGIYYIGDKSGEPLNMTTVLSAEQIKMSDNVVSHQLSLNEFVLDIESLGYEFTYYDEKYTSTLFTFIRPDGIIKTNTTFYFLEMDMNTERKKRLMKKWESYRMFFHSQDIYKFGLPIKVLFILGGSYTEKTGRRTDLTHYIYDNLYSDISERNNFYIGTKEELFNRVTFRDKPDLKPYFNSLKFNFKKVDFSDIYGKTYDGYAYMINEDKKIMTYNGKNMEFVVDSYTDNNLYVFSKYKSFDAFSAAFHLKFKRDIKYLIVVNNREKAFRLWSDAGINSGDIWFTTLEKMSEGNLGNMFFRFDMEGNLVNPV